ncbi:TPA: hypothetical protein KPW89_003827, partial [Clostridioides difficile]|nr:hypothetical protein [Clostridioides difficile]HBG2902332.1 hypothetical protein [Clostridioides difficile]
MSGQSALRGYVYQGLALIIESLEDKNWTHIALEFPTEQDKVDIALFKDSTLIKVIQVKSSINLFNKEDIKKWIRELIDDESSSKEYKLYLIGQCRNNANIFIKSVDKYNNRIIDEESKKSLNEFTSILENHKVSIDVIPFNKKYILGYIGDKLNKYLSEKDIILDPKKIDLAIDSCLGKILLLGTSSSPLTREELDDIMINFVMNSFEEKSNKISNKKYKNYIIFMIIPLILNLSQTLNFVNSNYIYITISLVLLLIVHYTFKISDNEFKKIIKPENMCNYTFNETPYIRVNVSLDNLMNEQIINIENISDNDITEIKGNINFFNNNCRVNTVRFNDFNIGRNRIEVINCINNKLGKEYYKRIFWNEVELNIEYIKT